MVIMNDIYVRNRGTTGGIEYHARLPPWRGRARVYLILQLLCFRVLNSMEYMVGYPVVYISMGMGNP